MGCTTNVVLDNIQMDCTSLPVGGMKRLLIANKSDIASNVTVAADGTVTLTSFSAGTVKEFSFSPKDGYTNFEDNKTVDLTGSVKVEPAIMVEFPKMTADKRKILDEISNPYAELVAFVQDSAGGYWMVGYDYGLVATEVKGVTGNGRGEKNVYQLKLSGDEAHLAYALDDTAWASVEAGLAAASTSA